MTTGHLKKVCLGACGRKLYLSAFGVYPPGKLGRRPRCNKCRAEEAKTRRKVAPPSTEAQKEVRRAGSKRFRQSEKGVASTKESQKRYAHSPKGKANRATWGLSTKGRQSHKNGSKRLHTKRREWLQTEKMRLGCIDCGYNKHPAALDFDHVQGTKSFVLSRSMGRCIETLQAEIAKCVVRCSNCHRIKTFEARQSGQNKLALNPETKRRDHE